MFSRLYFSGTQTSPGIIRAAKSIQSLIEMPDLKSIDVVQELNLIKADIEYKDSYRISVITPGFESRYLFVGQSTNIFSFASAAGIDLGSYFIRIERTKGKEIKDGDILHIEPRKYRAMMNNTGGIDLTSDKALSIQNNGQGIKFHIDPAMLKELQNTPGFVPVIISIQPMMDLKSWLLTSSP